MTEVDTSYRRAVHMILSSIIEGESKYRLDGGKCELEAFGKRPLGFGGATSKN